MATRNSDKPEAFWETALAALGMAVFLAGLFIAFALLEAGQHEPEERCFTGSEVCRIHLNWGTQR